MLRIAGGIPFFLSILWPGLSLAQTPSPPTGTVQVISLSQAISEALDKNLDLIAARFDIPVAQARIITARLRPNPIFSLEASHLIFPITTEFNKENAAGPNEYAIRTDFVLERGGKRERRIEVAEASKTVTELQVLNTVRTTVQNVETAFVDILQAKANLALASDSLRSFDEIVRINTIRVKNGDLAEVELIRSQVAQLQFENTVRQSELQVQTARTRLQVLLGRGITDPLVDASGEMRRNTISVDLAGLRQRAFAQRPDLLALRQDHIRSQAELRLQLAQGKVDYTIGSEYRRQQGDSAFGNTIGFFLQTNLPVFNRNQGEIARATQEQSQVEAKVRALETTVQNDVEIAYLQYNNALTILNRVEGALLKRATDVRQITEYSYRRGEASFLEFLDAQRAYIETMQVYNEARGDFARSLYGIDAATGTTPTGGPIAKGPTP